MLVLTARNRWSDKGGRLQYRRRRLPHQTPSWWTVVLRLRAMLRHGRATSAVLCGADTTWCGRFQPGKARACSSPRRSQDPRFMHHPGKLLTLGNSENVYARDFEP